MPIRPENLARYPPDWRAISDRIRFERAGGRCECDGRCGLHHGRRCVERHGEAAIYAKGRIVLTVAHLDHQPEHCDDDNLLAMCQRCHNRYDLASRSAGIAQRRAAARAEGQLELPRGIATSGVLPPNVAPQERPDTIE